MRHKHLNYLKRCQILGLWKAGFNWNQIAKEVGVHKSTISREFKRNLTYVRTSNGCEFARHEEISVALKTDFFFAHPYSSWEQGLNENTNGLVRQYIKKGAELIDITDEHLDIIAGKLNDRPRKTLGFKTPQEIFHE